MFTPTCWCAINLQLPLRTFDAKNLASTSVWMLPRFAEGPRHSRVCRVRRTAITSGIRHET